MSSWHLLPCPTVSKARGPCPQPHWTGQEAGSEGLSLSGFLLDPGFSPAGLDPSAAVAPAAAPNMPRRLQATVAFVVVTVIFSLMVLFIVGKLLGDLNPPAFLSFLHKEESQRVPDAPPLLP